MKDLDYQLGTREFLAVILLTVGIKFTDTTPTVLLREGHNSTWMIPILSMGITCISLLFLLPLLKKYKNKGLIEIINQTTGKFIGFIINVFLFLMIFLSTIVNSKSYVDIISGLFFHKTPLLFLIFCLVISFWFVANRGFDTIGRVAWLITPYIKVVLFFLLISIWENLDMSFIYPIFGPGIFHILKDGLNYSSIFSDIIVLAVLFPYVKNYPTFRNVSFVGLFITAIEISLFLFVFVTAFADPTVRMMNYPFQQLTRLATFGLGLQHVESIFLLFWIMASIVHFAIYLYTSTAIFCNTFKLKQVEPMLLPFAGLTIILGLFFTNITFELDFRNNSLVIGSYFIMFLPVVLWGVDKIKGFVHK